MDLNALMQAAMQDPAARDFIGKMVGGGAAPAPAADPRQMMAQSLQQAARSGPPPAPAFSGAKQAVDEMLRGFDPMAAMQPPAPMPDPAAQMGGPQGMPMPPQGMGAPPQGQMAPPAAPPGAGGGVDLMSMLMGGR